MGGREGLSDVKDLTKLFDDEEKRVVIIKDCVDLLNAEVKSKSGLSGITVKAGYGIVKALKPTMIQDSPLMVCSTIGEKSFRFSMLDSKKRAKTAISRAISALARQRSPKNCFR